jgi:hypothetical protein
MRQAYRTIVSVMTMVAFDLGRAPEGAGKARACLAGLARRPGGLAI